MLEKAPSYAVCISKNVVFRYAYSVYPRWQLSVEVSLSKISVGGIFILGSSLMEFISRTYGVAET